MKFTASTGRWLVGINKYGLDFAVSRDLGETGAREPKPAQGYQFPLTTAIIGDLRECWWPGAIFCDISGHAVTLSIITECTIGMG